MTRVSDEQLSAYLDGELPEEGRGEVETALGADPSLAARLAGMRAADAGLRQAFSHAVEEPTPPRLEALLQERSTASPVRAGISPILARSAQLAALAASFVMGIAVQGLLFGGQPSAFTIDSSGVVIASANASRALDQLRSGETARLGATTLAVRLSFRDGAGRFCREFQLKSAVSLSCRGEDGWLIEALESNPRVTEHAGYEMAGGPAANAMEAARARLGVRELLDASGEQRAIASGWRQTGQ